MKFIITIFSILYFGCTFAQSFDDLFYNKALRLDFVFEGNRKQTKTVLQPVNQFGEWHGRKVNLDTNNLQGDAEINVIDLKTNKVIYTQSFSSLYQEWLLIDASKTKKFKSEQVLYIPYPKNKFKIVVNFFNNNVATKAYEQTFDFRGRNIANREKANVTFKQLNASTNNISPINVAIVAEGFTKEEMQVFEVYANKTVNALFQHKAFAKHKDQFNIYAVFTDSKDSGISSPAKKIKKNTVAQSNFDTFGFERYLTTSNLFKLHDALAGFSFDHVIIIANTKVYGGGGIYNSYTLTSTFDKTFDAVVVHEFGHSFAGLADEYFYENDIFSDAANNVVVEPWNKNNTTLINFDAKWKNKLDANTPIPTPYTTDGTDKVGVYLGIKNGKVYIPHQHCRMHTNDANDFCSVCSNAIEDLILHYTKQK